MQRRKFRHLYVFGIRRRREKASPSADEGEANEKYQGKYPEWRAAILFLHNSVCVMCAQGVAFADDAVTIFYSLCHDVSDRVSYYISYPQRVSHPQRVVHNVQTLCYRRHTLFCSLTP